MIASGVWSNALRRRVALVPDAPRRRGAKRLRNHGVDNLAADRGAQALGVHLVGALAGQRHCLDRNRLAVFVPEDDLRLGVGQQPGPGDRAAQFRPTASILRVALPVTLMLIVPTDPGSPDALNGPRI